MSDPTDERPAFRYKAAEVAVALGFLLLGAIVVFDSVRLGAQWLVDGPQPGYFPFRVGVLICLASLVTLVRGLMIPDEKNMSFVEVGQLKLVLSVLVPAGVFVALVGWIGMYVSATLFVALFMRWLGKYPWWKVVSVSVGNSVVFFLIFETWFKVPLPKGPLEALLGIN